MSIVYLSGLPRSGSTLLCNVLNSHPNIKSSTSSPLCGLIDTMKSKWSDDPFLLSQLDNNFDNVYEKLKRSTKAFMEAWTNDKDGEVRIDKNRGWLHHLELLRELYPDFKMIITLRDLRNVYASIENQHRKTLLLDFPDHMEVNNIDRRASFLFGDNGVIGSCLKGLENIKDIPDISSHLFNWRFEDYLENPKETTKILFDWLEVDLFDFNPEKIEQTLFESDSYYRYKYKHTIHKGLKQPKPINEIQISPRILNTITTKFESFYTTYYPELLNKKPNEEPKNELSDIEEDIAKDIERALEEEHGNE